MWDFTAELCTDFGAGVVSRVSELVRQLMRMRKTMITNMCVVTGFV